MNSSLHGQQVLVLGLGESGLAMARWCARQGAAVSVWDSRETPPQLGALRDALPEAAVRNGELTADALHGVQRVLKSPGLSPHDARIAALLQAAREHGVPVQGELDLFVQALERLRTERDYAPQVLAVTGTNGKTTTTALTALLVERAGRSAVAAGNISPTMLDTLTRAIDDNTLPQVWVLELSSFQLDGVLGFEPHAAAVLNLTQDHLDWHGDMAAYAAAKARIFGERTVAVVNHEDPVVDAMASAPLPLPPPKPGAKAGKPRVPKPVQRTTVRFGLDAPAHPGDYGLVTEGGMAWLVRAIPDEPGARRKKDEPAEIHLQRLMPADALRVRGRHNAANALAALALATAIGCPLAPMLHGLREYGGEPHRVQPIGRVGEVEAFDDSKGTNVGATVAALQGLGAERKLVVILGGDGKGQDFAPLADPVARYARAAVLIGRDGPQIRSVLEAGGVPLVDAGSMEEAVKLATQRAHAGDAVLMSPACASFDMFRDYAHRAEVFRAAVQAVADEAGAMIEGGEA
ncbi:MAG TPA: UDP-N-acetylmuramoyl-L-alanine--D-glutamate ligase [Burkholderiaceae bacterium]